MFLWHFMCCTTSIIYFWYLILRSISLSTVWLAKISEQKCSKCFFHGFHLSSPNLEWIDLIIQEWFSIKNSLYWTSFILNLVYLRIRFVVNLTQKSNILNWLSSLQKSYFWIWIILSDRLIQLLRVRMSFRPIIRPFFKGKVKSINYVPTLHLLHLKYEIWISNM